MTQLNISLDFDELTEAITKSDMNTGMKGLAIAVFNAYMEAERDQFLKANRYGRSEDRVDSRNGYYDRDFRLAIGKLKLRVPRTRSGHFSTQLFEKYCRSDQAFVLSMVEAVVNGVSTRKVTNIVENLCGEQVSKSFVSSVMTRLDPEIKKFRERSLTYEKFPYLYVDALYLKVHEESRVVSKALYIAQGVNSKNKREILGFKVTGVESEESWSSFFRELRDRGLRQPIMVTSDAHAGLKRAIQKEFPGTSWQRCTAHFIRNITDKMPKKESRKARQLVSQIFKSSTKQEAKEKRAELEKLVEKKDEKKKYTRALEILDEGFEDALQYLSQPEPYQISLRTTNSLERLNQEIRRRERVVRIFPNEAAAERLFGAILQDYHDQWQEQKRTFLRDFSPEFQ